MAKDFYKEAWGWGVGSASARSHIPKGVKEDVWKKYNGNKMEGKCYVNKEHRITFSIFEVGHNKAIAKGGSNKASNLRPICRKCNLSMGTMSIEAYKKKYYTGSKTKKKKTTKKTTKKKSKEFFKSAWS